MRRFVTILLLIILFASCSNKLVETIPIISYGGIPQGESDSLFPLVQESGIDICIVWYKDTKAANADLNKASPFGLKLIPAVSGFGDNTELIVNSLKDNTALYGYFVKDEPEMSDLDSLGRLVDSVWKYDPVHPSYINLYPNWAWGIDDYEDKIAVFAKKVDVKFYSFDQYPITMGKDSLISIRPTWYKNLEQIARLAKINERPFYAFALTTSHHLTAPSPEAYYPVPTLGHIRLQVFSNLLYGAQGIEYFTFKGLYDSRTHAKEPIFDIVKQVNSEIKGYSRVFLGCEVLDTWHIGKDIPETMHQYYGSPDKCIKHFETNGQDALVSLIKNKETKYLAVQNKDCVQSETINIEFNKTVKRIFPRGERKFSGGEVALEPGNVAIFKLN